MTSLHTSMRIIEQSRDPVVGSVDVFLERLRAGKSIALPPMTTTELHAKIEWHRLQARMHPVISASIGRRGKTPRRTDPATKKLARRLRRDGWTFARIGEALGISRKSAREALTEGR